MICPRCHKFFNLTKQIQEWEEVYGDEAVICKDFPIFIAVFCDNCKKPIADVFIEPEIVNNDVEIMKAVKKATKKVERSN